MIRVLDVGAPQGLITNAHWQAIAANGVRGVYCRCGNGNEAPDPTFDANVAGAQVAGLAVGAYAVGFPLPMTPEHVNRAARLQALAHVEQSGGMGMSRGEMPPCLDFEWPLPVDWPKWGVTASSARAWLREYRDTLSPGSLRPVLYTYVDFWMHVIAGATAAEIVELGEGWDLWIARYGVSSPPTLPPWTEPKLWQKSDGGGRLPSGAPVDEDLFLGGEDEWQAFLGTGPTLPITSASS